MYDKYTSAEGGIGTYTTTAPVTSDSVWEKQTAPVRVTGVTLFPLTLSITAGNTAILAPAIMPSNATDKTVTWNTSNSSIATVTNGVVSAIAAGTATITVTTTDGGKTATCAVTVLTAPVARIGITEYTTLTDAIAAAANGSAGDPTEIVILRNIIAARNGTNDYAYSIPANKNIKLTVEPGESRTITASAGDFKLFSITNLNSSLTLEGNGAGILTLNGGKEAAALNRHGVFIGDTTFTINNDVTITGFNSAGNGGGVYINGGTFAMNNGEISGNTSPNGGGVYVGPGGTFTMSGGYVYGADGDTTYSPQGMPNTATTSGASVYVAGTANYSGGYGTDSITTTNGSLPLIAYTVTFDKNGGDTDASPTTRTANYSTTVALPTAPTRTGHGFNGWYDTSAASGGTQFTASTAVTGNITVYARWTINNYTVTFDKNGGTTEASPTSRNADYNTTVTLPTAPTRTGYTFANWYDTSATTGGNQFTASTAVTGNTTVYARWTANTLSISYAAGTGGSGSAPTSPTSATYGNSVTMPANTYTKTGYSFAGWAVSGTNSITGTYAAGTSKSVADLSTGINTGNASITLTATWTINSYTVTFNKNGGTTEANPTTKTADYNGNVGTLPTAPTRTGYTFVNWYDTSAATGGNQFTASTAVTGNITVYARWTAKTYTISFNQNGGSSGQTATVTATYNSAMPTITSTPKISEALACKFIGYFDAATGGNKYYNADKTSAKNWDKDANTTLYAQWGEYDLGDEGPGGGAIFYKSTSGFTMTNYGTCYYLEAAPDDLSSKYKWDSRVSPLDMSGTGTSLGSGRKNTYDVLLPTGTLYWSAAEACRTYTNGRGNDDWFLPSKDELNLLRTNKSYTSIPAVSSTTYWSSSQSSQDKAWAYKMDSSMAIEGAKSNSSSVRPIRAF